MNLRSLFSIHDPVGVKLLTRLWLQFSHFNGHKSRHNFKDCVSPMCDCGAETETISHFFLHCQCFANERQKLRDDVYQIDASIKNLNEESLIDSLLMVQIGLTTVNVLKDLLLTSANFVQLLPLCFSLTCLLKPLLQCKLLSS